MLSLIRRMFAPTRARALEAGAHGRRWSGAPVHSRSLNSEIGASGQTIRARARHVVRNSPVAASAAQNLVSGLVGPTGLRPVLAHPDAETREAVHDLWGRWCQVCDFDGGQSLAGLTTAAARAMVIDGEAFAHLLIRDGGPADLPGLRVRLYGADQLPHDHPMTLRDNRVRGGVELSDDGRPVAYHFLHHPPDEYLQPLTKAWETARVDAADVCHLFRPEEIGQLRGASWFTPVLLALADLDQFYDAQLMRAKVAALLAGVIIDPDGNGAGLGGDQDGATLTSGLEPGTLISLPPGKSIEFLDPKESAHFSEFSKAHLRSIASGLGLPFEVLTGDLQDVNYSSIRAGLIEYRRRLEGWQNNLIVHKFLQPIWDRFVSLAALQGLIDGYDADPAAFHRVSWLAPKQPWVDPAKDVAADAAAVAAGFRSRSSVIASLGRDPEQVDRELAADQARARRLGLRLDGAGNTLPDAGTDDDDADDNNKESRPDAA